MDKNKERSPTAEDFISLRKSTGMNRKEFSTYLKIPYNTICDWEAGDRKPPEYVYSLIKEKVERDRPVREASKGSILSELKKQKERSCNGREEGLPGRQKTDCR